MNGEAPAEPKGFGSVEILHGSIVHCGLQSLNSRRGQAPTLLSCLQRRPLRATVVKLSLEMSPDTTKFVCGAVLRGRQL